MRVLLLEPKYKNKYPPIGLMKISHYHKKIRKDKVKFCKMSISDRYYTDEYKWDMIYVTTLFTFEWERTIEMIKEAFELIDKNGQVVIGGILATLMKEDLEAEILKIKNNESEFEVKVIERQLDRPGLLDFNGNKFERSERIDNLPLDYSILNDIDYDYPWSNAFYGYMTRGCGMDCEFCAVKTLEPDYKSYISIEDNIEYHRKEQGIEKRNLLLLDNNVLVSKNFEKIIDEIIDMGFEKGAVYTKPDTGATVKRYVDFNQGLDANLMTKKKVELLSKIALKPARIAFDHISGKEKYIKATKLCANHGIDNFSNYMLFNTDDFKGKGVDLKADKPKELYERMNIAVELKKELNEKHPNLNIKMYSFPMRFKPLDGKRVGDYIGKNWNKKYLRAVQVMLNPTMGKGVSSESYFKVAFGEDENEYMYNLILPESLLMIRGKILRRMNDSDIDYKERINRLSKKDLRYKKYYDFFQREYNKIERKKLLRIIEDNNLNIYKFNEIKDKKLKIMYLFYLSNSKLSKLITKLLNEKGEDINLLKEFFETDIGIVKYNELSDYVYMKQISKKKTLALYDLFGDKLLNDIFKMIAIDNLNNNHIIRRLERVFDLIKKRDNINNKIKNNKLIVDYLKKIEKVVKKYPSLKNTNKVRKSILTMLKNKKNEYPNHILKKYERNCKKAEL